MLKLLILLIALFGFSQSDVPFKAKEEFQLDLDFKFKQRQASNASTFEPEGNRDDFDKLKYGGGPLPYLIVNLTVLKLNTDEVRIRAVDGAGEVIISRKAEISRVFPMDLGFTVDMKDRISPHEYFVYFLSNQKKEVSKIHLTIEEDGTFMVNGEIRGKF